MKNLLSIILTTILLSFTACSNGDDNNNNNNNNNDNNNNQGAVTDANGNTYRTVIIGDLEWFSENLRATETQTGVEIPLITDDEAWKSATSPAYTYVDDLVSNVPVYGLLYNGYITSLEGLCPEGWRMPTSSDVLNLQQTLEDLYGDPAEVMKDMDSGLWNYSPDFDYFNGHNNASGFSARPSGYRNAHHGNFKDVGWGTHFWKGTNISSNYREGFSLDTNGFSNILLASNVRSGHCVRCVRDVE